MPAMTDPFEIDVDAELQISPAPEPEVMEADIEVQKPDVVVAGADRSTLQRHQPLLRGMS